MNMILTCGVELQMTSQCSAVTSHGIAHCKQNSISISNAGDTQSKIFYKKLSKLVQVSCTRNLQMIKSNGKQRKQHNKLSTVNKQADQTHKTGQVLHSAAEILTLFLQGRSSSRPAPSDVSSERGSERIECHTASVRKIRFRNI